MQRTKIARRAAVKNTRPPKKRYLASLVTALCGEESKYYHYSNKMMDYYNSRDRLIRKRPSREKFLLKLERYDNCARNGRKNWG